jgi:hypothetical protein
MSDLATVVRNELLFREVNERIFQISSRQGEGLEVLCECGDESCISTLTIAVPDYERIRVETSRFVVCNGHELRDIERVIERTPAYLVVEKTGEARKILDHWKVDRTAT